MKLKPLLLFANLQYKLDLCKFLKHFLATKLCILLQFLYCYIIKKLLEVFIISVAITFDFKVYGKPPRLPCNLRGNLKVMVILPSTMFFTQSVHVSEREIVLQDRGMYRVCYCFHSSMQEVRDLVTYLQPRQVFPNVKPAEDKTLRQVCLTEN